MTTDDAFGLSPSLRWYHWVLIALMVLINLARPEVPLTIISVGVTLLFWTIVIWGSTMLFRRGRGLIGSAVRKIRKARADM